MFYKFWVWLKRRFGKSKPNKPKKKRRKIDRTWQLHELLERLEEEHDRYKLKKGFAVCPKSEWRGLRAMGAFVMPSKERYIPNLYLPDIYKMPEDWSDKALPHMMYVGWRIGRVMEKNDEEDFIPVTAVWAIKQPQKNDWNVQRIQGTRYLVGQIGEDLSSQKEITVCSYVDLDFKCRLIRVPRLIIEKDVVLPKGGGYCVKTWGVPEIHGADVYRTCKEEFSSIEEVSARVLVSCFGACYTAWMKRHDYYQISTRRKKSKVTFCVDKGEQKFFFKDRKKTVMAHDGKRKRIIHYVGAFTRSNGQHVKEHLRGIRQFFWNGYKVTISVPRFHLQIHDFDAQSIDKEDMSEGEKYYTAKGTAKKLGEFEEADSYRHGHFG